MRVYKNNKETKVQGSTSATEDHELCIALSESLGVTKQEVLEALRAVGENKEDVERYIAVRKWKR
jgi:Holliday junction resolvasome RuvABC DNA-binding subunit